MDSQAEKILRAAFGPVWGFVERFGARVERSRFDEPDAELGRMLRRLKAVTDPIPSLAIERFARRMMGVVAHPVVERALDTSLERMARDVKRDALAAHPKTSLLFRLFDEAHRAVPYSPLRMLVLPGSTPMGAEVSVVRDLDAAARLRGEVRMRAVGNAIRGVVETVGEPYLRALYDLAYYREGAWPRQPSAPGAVANQLGRKFEGSPYTSLLPQHMVERRNAFAHASMIYRDDHDSVLMWTSRESMRGQPPDEKANVGELLSWTTDLYRLAGSAFRGVCISYLFRALAPMKVVLQLAPDLIDSDAATRAAAEELVNEKLAREFGPLYAFVRHHAGPDEPMIADAFAGMRAFADHVLRPSPSVTHRNKPPV